MSEQARTRTLTRIVLTDLVQTCTDTCARDAFFRTYSHTLAL